MPDEWPASNERWYIAVPVPPRAGLRDECPDAEVFAYRSHEITTGELVRERATRIKDAAHKAAALAAEEIAAPLRARLPTR